MRSLSQLIEELESGRTPGIRVLLRADLNVPLQHSGPSPQVGDDTRIRAVLPTLSALCNAGARVIVCSHLGRPDGVDPRFSLAPVAARLGELLRHLGDRESDIGNSAVAFVEGVPGKSARDAVDALLPGQVVLLDNLRFHPGEKSNDPDFAAELSSLADVFVNDAFGSCHRAHASVVGVAALLPSYGGLLVQREVEALTPLLLGPERPYWVILGGAKVADKLGVVRKLWEKVDGFIVGGGMANTFLAGLNVPVGASRVESERLQELREVIESSEGSTEWVFPVDFIAGDVPIHPKTVTQVEKGGDPGELSFFDVGPKTRAIFLDRLHSARTIFWNGPLGVFEEPAFATATHEVAAMLSEHSGVRVIGGGDTAAAVQSFGYSDAMSHVSTGGGASLEFLEGKELPGLRALGGLEGN